MWGENALKNYEWVILILYKMYDFYHWSNSSYRMIIETWESSKIKLFLFITFLYLWKDYCNSFNLFVSGSVPDQFRFEAHFSHHSVSRFTTLNETWWIVKLIENLKTGNELTYESWWDLRLRIDDDYQILRWFMKEKFTKRHRTNWYLISWKRVFVCQRRYDHGNQHLMCVENVHRYSKTI